MGELICIALIAAMLGILILRIMPRSTAAGLIKLMRRKK